MSKLKENKKISGCAIIFLLIMASLTSCLDMYGIRTHTRKPVSDLKTETITTIGIDPRVHIQELRIIKIDTSLNLFKAEALIGITIKGKIDKSLRFPNSIDYFEDLKFIELIGNNEHQISINIVPTLKNIDLNSNKNKKPRKTDVTYQDVSDGTMFECYVEKKIIIPNFGGYSVMLICGEQRTALNLQRTK